MSHKNLYDSTMVQRNLYAAVMANIPDGYMRTKHLQDRRIGQMVRRYARRLLGDVQ